MEPQPSQMHLSAAIIVLLLVVAASEMEPLQMKKCSKRSGSFKGWCLHPRSCSDVCEAEDNNNISGECRGFPSRCYCVFYCLSTMAATPESDQILELEAHIICYIYLILTHITICSFSFDPQRNRSMEPSREKLSAAVVLLLLVLAADMGTQVQAGECLSRSIRFRGLCFSSNRCADVCRQEGNGYSGGSCRGINLRCFCITPCTTASMPEP
ncbi:hypothetical protein EJB05_23573, partial [Eragrostis curvula]